MGLVIGIDGRPANGRTRVGIGRLCHEFLRVAPGRAGDASLVVYLDAPPRDDFPDTEGQVCVRVLPSGRLWTQRVLARELQRDPPDVFYSTTLQLPVRGLCPKVATVLDLAFYDFGAYFPWQRRLRARVEARLTVSRAAHLIAISEATKLDLIKRFGVDDGRVSVAHLGVSERFHPGGVRPDASRPQAGGIPAGERYIPAEVRERYGLPERYVLYVGRLQPRKNLVRLVQAFERVIARCPDLPHGLVLAGGPGWMEEDLRNAVARSPVRTRILLPGYVADTDLTGLVAGADVLALVSLWEGFGLPLIEAMQCGTAVLASNCSSMPEVTGDAGTLVDPFDVDSIALGLERLLIDDAYRAAQAESGLIRARAFTWERFADRVIEALRGAAAT